MPQLSISTLLLFAAFYGATANDVDCVGSWGNGCVDDDEGMDGLAMDDYSTDCCPTCEVSAEHCETILVHYGIFNPCKMTCGALPTTPATSYWTCTPLSGKTCEPGVCGDIVYTVRVPASGEGAACEAADGETAVCDVGDSGCAVTDCVGSWSKCAASVEGEACTDKTYTISANAMVGGAECPADHNQPGASTWFNKQKEKLTPDSTAVCTDGDGDCVVADCVGSWSECGAACTDKTYTVTTARSGGGTKCARADGAKAACVGGDGTCVAGDCVGSWSECEAECADKTYTVATAALGGGAECPEDDGDTAGCTDGDGLCVAADCDGSWSACEAGCADKTFTVTTVCEPYPASEDDGATAACVAGDGDCVALNAASASTSSFFGTVAVACVGATLL